MTYRDLILLKALFSTDLHNAILDLSYKKVDEIMLTRYKSDLELHSIVNLGTLNLVDVKREHLEECDTDLSWAL